MNIIVAAIYHFFDFPGFAEQRGGLLAAMQTHQVRGTILLTPEGINGTIAGARAGIDAVLAYLRDTVVGGPFEHKESQCAAPPFLRTKVKLKRETISLGEPVALEHVGRTVAPADWNALIADPDTIVLDARNEYEVEIGTFARALNPMTRNFKELPAYVRGTLGDRKQARIATFCTGGIRCEKLTAWMAQEGFTEVYHLQGGILKYLEEVPPADSLWQGECFVFDDRVAVGQGLNPHKLGAGDDGA